MTEKTPSGVDMLWGPRIPMRDGAHLHATVFRLRAPGARRFLAVYGTEAAFPSEGLATHRGVRRVGEASAPYDCAPIAGAPRAVGRPHPLCRVP